MLSVYLVIKQCLIALLLIGAFSLFAIRVRRLIVLMQSVKGVRKQAKSVPLTERIGIFFSDVLGQSNVRRKCGIGLAHTAIFFGFLFIQPHSVEMVIHGLFPGFSLHNLFPVAYTAFLAVTDWVALACMAGFSYVVYRRAIVKPSWLPKSPDAVIIISLATAVVVTFFLLNALATVSPYAANGELLSKAVVVSSSLTSLFGMGAWSEQSRILAFEVIYWVHLSAILGFLVYIPASKHLHLLAAVPNVVLKPTAVEKSIIKTDIEDEHVETFGLGFINELSWKQVLDLYSCTQCGRCEEQCPAARSGKSLSPCAFIFGVKTELFENAPALIKGREVFQPLVREQGHVLPAHLWECTTCRACEAVCPLNIQHLDMVFEARKYQVLMEAAFPTELGDTFTNVENQSNPWGFASSTRGDWAKESGIPHISEMPDAEIVYFAGSALSLDDRGKKVSQALMRVLKKAGVRVAVYGSEEHDTGDDIRRLGNEYLAQLTITENMEMLSRYNVSQILTACPHTFNILKNEYPDFGKAFDVVHHSSYLLELIQTGRLQVTPKDMGIITYHDPCYLGRWNGLFEAPRALLQQINNGTAVEEMEAKKEKTLCCGGGGGRMFMEEDSGQRMNVIRTKQALATDADIIAVACPYCLTMFSDGLGECGSGAVVKDIAEIVESRVKEA